LSCFKQPSLPLGHLHKNETFAGAGAGVLEATAWRYVAETPEVLASSARACTKSWSGDFVIVDGHAHPR
jgi:hypothetical protein